MCSIEKFKTQSSFHMTLIKDQIEDIEDKKKAISF